MKTAGRNGFTIIEVMLFLAVTGLLIAGIMGSTASSLYRQRYRDGVESVRNVIRSQYETSFSLQNMTGTGDSSNPLAGQNAVDPCTVIDSPTGATEEKVYRGSSDCLYVGRFIVFKPDVSGKFATMSVYPIVAKVIDSRVSGVFPGVGTGGGDATDATSLRAAAYTRNANIVTEKQLDWGLVPVQGNSTHIQTVGLIVFRSPLTGAISTYVVDNPDENSFNHLDTYLTPGSTRDVTLCMADLTGPLDPARRTAVVIHKGATGPGDVETLGDAPQCQ